VALIEQEKTGGTCLNRGCIPTKALIQSAKTFSLAKKANDFGVCSDSIKIDFNAVCLRKDKIVSQLLQGLNFSLKGIDFIASAARLISANEIQVNKVVLAADSMIIATGSKVFELPGFKFDGTNVLSSDDILDLKQIPGSLLIIGGGVIGCEFASLFSNLGSQVTIAEKFSRLLPGEDPDISRKLEGVFRKKGIKVLVDNDASACALDAFERILVCVGRIPMTEGLGLEEAGIRLTGGRIVVDEYLRTSIPNIYAAGDCTAKIMLAHYAAYQGQIAAENIANPSGLKKADNPNVPSCIFTDPEIASIGIKEEAAQSAGIAVKIDRFDFLGSGMARILGETEGFIKIVSDKGTDKILGASIIGPRATELIAVLTLAVTCGLKVSQVKDTIFAHPTLSESIRDALK
jgi:dihydrolipoamide dehydrogenase